MALDFIQIAEQNWRAVRGFDLDRNFRRECPPCDPPARPDWDHDDIVGVGSGNIFRSKHANEIAYQRTRDSGEYQAASDAAIRYCHNQRIAGNHESMSVFVYGGCCHCYVGELVRQVGIKRGDDALVWALNVHSLAEAYLMAACGGQRLYDGIGRPTVMAGPRSWTKDDRTGHPYEMLVEADNPISGVAAWLTDRQPLRGWVGEVDSACHDTLGHHLWDNLPGLDRAYAKALAEWDGPATPERLAALAAWRAAHEVSTGVPGTFSLYVFEGGKAGLQEDAYNYGSTSFLYARAFYRAGRPDGWWTGLPYGNDSRILWLASCAPTRTTGEDGFGRLEGGALQCQRATGDYYDEVKRQCEDGWKSIPVPPGDLCLHVRISGRAFEVPFLLGADVEPPHERLRARFSIEQPTRRRVFVTNRSDQGGPVDLLDWGDGEATTIKVGQTKEHRYPPRPASYRIKLTARRGDEERVRRKTVVVPEREEDLRRDEGNANYPEVRA